MDNYCTSVLLFMALADKGRILSTGGRGKLPPKTFQLPPPKKKVFPEKKIWKLFQILILFDDVKESVKATNVQKCDFSQY